MVGRYEMGKEGDGDNEMDFGRATHENTNKFIKY